MSILNQHIPKEGFDYQGKDGVVRRFHASYQGKDIPDFIFTSVDKDSIDDFKLSIASYLKNPIINYVMCKPYNNKKESVLLKYNQKTGELSKIITKEFSWEFYTICQNKEKINCVIFRVLNAQQSFSSHLLYALIPSSCDAFNKTIDYLMKRETEIHQTIEGMTGIKIGSILKKPSGTSLLKYKTHLP